MSAAVVSPAARRRWWWFLWGLVAALAIGITAYFVTPYLHGSSTVPIDMSIPGYYVSLVIHVVPAGLALVIGPWQFVPRLRARFPRVHQMVGRVYLVSVLAAALAATYSAAVTPSGFPFQVAFYLLLGLQLMNVIPALQYKDVYTSSAWAALLGNVLVAEYFIIQRTLSAAARRRRTVTGTAHLSLPHAG